MDANEKLLESVATRWAEVQDENKAHKSLVTESEWDQWVSFAGSRTDRVLGILNSNAPLTEADVAFLKSLEGEIDGARRMTEVELTERKKREVESARKKKQNEADEKALQRIREREAEERKAHRKGLLQRLFGE